MANIIKIKRSSATATPTSLNEGELAFSYLSGKLFIGNSSAVIPIGGTHNPGVLTANQALVVNASSEIDKIIVANLVPTFVYANGAFGTNGQVLTANSTGGVHWAVPVTDIGGLSDVDVTSPANNQILVYDGTAGKWENHTVSGNSGQVNATFVAQDLQLSLEPTVNVSTAINVGANVNLTTSSITVGNSTVNAVINSTSVVVDGNVSADKFLSTDAGLAAPVNGTYTGERVRLYDFNSNKVNYAIGAESNHVWTSVDGNSNTVGFKWYGNTVQVARLGGTGTLEIKDDFYTDASVNANVSVKVGANVVTNTSALLVGNSTVNSVLSSGLLTVGANVTVNTDTIFIGNSTVNTTIKAGNIALRGTELTVGANVVLNDSSVTVGNSTVNTSLTATSFGTGNATFTGFINVGTTANVGGDITARANVTVNGALTVANTAALGNTTITGFANVSGDLNVNGNVVLGDNFGVDVVSFKSTVNTEISPSSNNNYNLGRADLRWGEVNANNVLATNVAVNSVVTVGSNVTVNTSALLIGNSTVTAVVNSTALLIGSNVTLNNQLLSIGNSTVNTAINSTSISTGVLNSTDLTVNGFINVSSTANIGGVVTARANVVVNGALTVANTADLGNTTITGFANISGDLTVGGNVALGSSATNDVISVVGLVNTNIIPSANLTYSLGNNTLYWSEVHTGNVHADYGYFEHDVAILGDLTITGNLVTVNVQSVVLSDPKIFLASNNNTSDLVDIGFAGLYHTGGTNLHTGLIRHAAVDEYYLFKGLTQDVSGTLTVNIADPTFALADLNAWLQSGALISNSDGVTITANSTVNVNITANSLLLSTALTVNSGGTGLATVTTNGILFGNTTGPLGVTAAGTHGQVLQANSTGGPVFADLDGGTF